MPLPNMNDVNSYTNHYLKQLSGSTGDKGHDEMNGSSQSGGLGLGNSCSLTSRYIIPTSITSDKAFVSVDVHEHDSNDSGCNYKQTNGKYWRRRRLPRKKREKVVGSKSKQVGGMRGSGKSAPKQHTRKKVGRFDHLKNNY